MTIAASGTGATSSGNMLSVSLSGNSSAVTVPGAITVPADSTSAKFTANFFAVTSAQGVTMMERAGNVLKSFMLQLNAAVLALTINATGVAFCDVPATTSATQPALLTSRGSEPVAINAATLTGAGRTMSGVEFPVTPNPGPDAMLDRELDPSAVGVPAGQLTQSGNSSPNAMTATIMADPSKYASGTAIIAPPAGTTYYLAPATAGGNDSNDGLSPAAPWLTPDHSVNCGDVILAAAGSYPPFLTFGTVTCPKPTT